MISKLFCHILPIVRKLLYSVMIMDFQGIGLQENTYSPTILLLSGKCQRGEPHKKRPKFRVWSYIKCIKQDNRHSSQILKHSIDLFLQEDKVIESTSDIWRDIAVCPIHHTQLSLNDCRVFDGKSYQEWKTFLKDKIICFRCCTSSKRIAKNCTNLILCRDCNTPFCFTRRQAIWWKL